MVGGVFPQSDNYYIHARMLYSCIVVTSALCCMQHILSTIKTIHWSVVTTELTQHIEKTQKWANRKCKEKNFSIVLSSKCHFTSHLCRTEDRMCDIFRVRVHHASISPGSLVVFTGVYLICLLYHGFLPTHDLVLGSRFGVMGMLWMQRIWKVWSLLWEKNLDILLDRMSSFRGSGYSITVIGHYCL